MRNNSDSVASHSAITGIADVALRVPHNLQRTPHLTNTPLFKVY
jgi:hypothetical protein